MENEEIRAIAGLCYAAYKILFKSGAQAEQPVGSATRRLCKAAGIEAPYADSQMQRLVEEALKYISHHPIG